MKKDNAWKIVGIIIAIFMLMFIITMVIRSKNGNGLEDQFNVIAEKASTDKVDTESEMKTEKYKKEVIEKTDAIYEEWLAAAMVIMVSFDYAVFEIKEVYYNSETDLNDKLKSKGVYMSFVANGEQKCIYCQPLKEENKKEGSVNLYTSDLGFTSVEFVKEADVDFKEYKQLSVDDLTELIQQSMQVSVYRN